MEYNENYNRNRDNVVRDLVDSVIAGQDWAISLTEYLTREATDDVSYRPVSNGLKSLKAMEERDEYVEDYEGRDIVRAVGTVAGATISPFTIGINLLMAGGRALERAINGERV